MMIINSLQERKYVLLKRRFPSPEQVRKELLRRKAAPTRIGDLDELPALSAIASRLEPEMRRRFIRVIERTQQRLVLEDLANAIQSGRIQNVEDLIDIPLFREQLEEEFVGTIQTGFLRGAEFANKRLENIGLGLNFDLINPHATAFISRHIPELVNDIGQQMGRNVQDILGQAFDQGIPPTETAIKIRDVIGLTPRDIALVNKFEAKSRAEGMDIDTLISKRNKLINALIRRRSITIARTELIRAHNMGQQSLWSEATNQGLLNPDNTKREWIATPDDRVDISICLPLDGSVAELNKPFNVQGLEVMAPPAHPNCRCALGLVFKDRTLGNPDEVSIASPPDLRNRKLLDAIKDMDAEAIRKVVRETSLRVAEKLLSSNVISQADVDALIADAVNNVNVPQPIKKFMDASELQGVEALISTMLNTWKATSADTNPISYIHQLAVRDEFGLESTSTLSHLNTSFSTLRASEEFYQRHKKVFKAIVRGVYEDTQEALAARNISSVTVFRGISLDESINVQSLRTVKKFTDVTMMPISSFSADLETATSFVIVSSRTGGAVLAATVPASEVYGTALTGVGTNFEQEAVLLGRNQTYWFRFMDKETSFSDPGILNEIREDFRAVSQ